MMQRVPRSRRQLLPPDTVDEGIDRHDPSAPESEHRQHGLALRAAHVRLPLAHEHLERAENTDLQWLLHGLLPPERESLTPAHRVKPAVGAGASPLHSSTARRSVAS